MKRRGPWLLAGLCTALLKELKVGRVQLRDRTCQRHSVVSIDHDDRP
jgi:hypothetical protein